MKFQRNISLAKYTTFRIGGQAKYFFIAKTKKDLILAIQEAKRKKLPFFILGNGSNVLISDKGFDGLVIKIQNSKFKIQNSKIIAEAGVYLGKLVNESAVKGLSGLEWAIGIPGTVGGAVYGNAGAFKKSMGDVVEEVELYDTKNQEFKILKNKNCKFDYRDSIFKHNKNLIIVSATIKLKKSNKKETKKKIKEYLNYKRKTQPLSFHSAGSIFKNSKNFSAAELIERCNLKGKKIGKAKISEKHANFIINLGGAKAKDVIKLINLIKKSVKNKFGIILKEEIQYLDH